MIDKIALLFPYPAEQLVEVGPIIKLIEQSNKEVCISRRVDKVPTGTFILWFPDLDCHGFGEDLLRKFALSRGSSSSILGVIVYNMCSLSDVSLRT